MSSRLPSAGDLYGLAGGGPSSTPIHFPYLRSDHPSATAKRPMSEMEHQQHPQSQQQHLHHALLLRSVKPKTHNYLHPSPISPFDLDSTTTTTTSSYSSIPFNYAFIKQQLLLQQQQQQRQAVTTQIKSQLEELEKHLLDDSDEPPTLSTSATCEWNDTMQSLISISPSPTTSSSSSTSSSCSPSTSSSKKLLLDAAAAIAEGNTETALATLSAIRRGVNPRSADSEQRLCGYLISALMSRMNSQPEKKGDELCSGEHLVGTQLLYEFSPCFKLGFLAANLAIMDSTRGLPKLHLVDFDIGQGGQYLALLNTLSAVPVGTRPTTVKITAVADPFNPYTTNTGAPNLVKAAGDRLAKLAERAGVAFHFNVVSLRTSELTRSALGCDPDDPLIVNFAFHLHKMADESVTPANPRDELLRRVRALNPKLVTLVEQELNGNTTPFLSRFSESSAYYAALFDSLDATMGKDTSSSDRARIEECLARKATNTIAREGTDRVHRCEVFGKWRARMGMAGFRPTPLAAAAAESLRSRLSSGRVANPGFTVKEDNGGLCFGYSGRILAVASAWH